MRTSKKFAEPSSWAELEKRMLELLRLRRAVCLLNARRTGSSIGRRRLGKGLATTPRRSQARSGRRVANLLGLT
jgi:hypothetical protein